jgi:hypothetical protein
MKTVFSSGVIVTSSWLNGAQQIYFDGAENDWHYPPLGLNSLVQTGPNGLDSAYVTLDTDQPSLITTGPNTGLYSSGTPISGTKVVTGVFNFGYDPTIAGNPANTISNAPRSYTTNGKYENAAGTPTPSISQKFAVLDNSDLVTKLVLLEQIENLLETLEIDNGVYENASGTCSNYSVGAGNSDTICPL